MYADGMCGACNAFDGFFFFFPPVGHQDPNCGQTRAISIQAPCRRFRAQDAAGENKENGHLMMTLLT